MTPQEAVWFNLDWKVPCVLHYTAIPAPEPTQFVSPLTYDVFGEDKCIARSGGTRGITFTPLASDEMPKKGRFLCCIISLYFHFLYEIERKKENYCIFLMWLVLFSVLKLL